MLQLNQSVNQEAIGLQTQAARGAGLSGQSEPMCHALALVGLLLNQMIKALPNLHRGEDCRGVSP